MADSTTNSPALKFLWGNNAVQGTNLPTYSEGQIIYNKNLGMLTIDADLSTLQTGTSSYHTIYKNFYQAIQDLATNQSIVLSSINGTQGRFPLIVGGSIFANSVVNEIVTVSDTQKSVFNQGIITSDSYSPTEDNDVATVKYLNSKISKITLRVWN